MSRFFHLSSFFGVDLRGFKLQILESRVWGGGGSTVYGVRV